MIKKATATKVEINSDFLKDLSASGSNVTSVDLTDPQGLDQLMTILRRIVNKFNSVYAELNSYKNALSPYVTFGDYYGPHPFKAT